MFAQLLNTTLYMKLLTGMVCVEKKKRSRSSPLTPGEDPHSYLGYCPFVCFCSCATNCFLWCRVFAVLDNATGRSHVATVCAQSLTINLRSPRIQGFPLALLWRGGHSRSWASTPTRQPERRTSENSLSQLKSVEWIGLCPVWWAR